MNRASLYFLGAMILSFLGAIQTHTATDAFEVFVKLLKFSCIYIMIIGTVDTRERLEKCVWVYALCMIFLVAEPLYLYLQGRNLYYGEGGLLRLRGVGQFDSPNALGVNAVSTIVLLYFLFWHYRSYILKGFFVAAALASLKVIMVTASRSAYLAFLILIFFLFLFSKRRLRFLIVTCALAGILFAAVPQVYRDRFISIEEIGDAVGSDERLDGSIGGRWALVRDAWIVFLQHPIFGCGMDSFRRIALDQKKFGTFAQPHSLIMQALAETGVVGLAAICFLIVTLWGILNETKTKISKVEQNRDFLVMLTRALQVMLLVNVMIGILAQQTMYSNIWWIMAGFAVASSRIVDRWTEGLPFGKAEDAIRVEPAFNR